MDDLKDNIKQLFAFSNLQVDIVSDDKEIMLTSPELSFG